MASSLELAKFIQELRKEKGLTQKDLAVRLSVTVQAVSKWETGKCYPDVYLFKPLCDILDITVVELMNAKRIKLDNMKNETEKTIIDTLQENRKKTKKIILRSLLTIFIVGLIIACFFTYRNHANKLGRLISFHYIDSCLEISDLYLTISNDYKTQRYTDGTLKILNNDLKDGMEKVEVSFCYGSEECYQVYQLNSLSVSKKNLYNLDYTGVKGILNSKGKKIKTMKEFEDKIYSINIVVDMYYKFDKKTYILPLKSIVVINEHSSLFKLKR